MKKVLLLLGVVVCTIPGFAQLLSWSPAFQTEGFVKLVTCISN